MQNLTYLDQLEDDYIFQAIVTREYMIIQENNCI